MYIMLGNQLRNYGAFQISPLSCSARFIFILQGDFPVRKMGNPTLFFKKYSSLNHNKGSQYLIGNSCWKCEARNSIFDLFCNAPLCGVIQNRDLADINIFNMFGLESIYNINEASLDSSFKNLQMKLHPDKFSTRSEEEKYLSTKASAQVNIAYQTLKSPISRADYLLKKKFSKSALDIEDRQFYKEDNMMLAEIFTFREKVESLGKNQKEIIIFKAKLDQEIETAKRKFCEFYDLGEGNGAAGQVIRLQFLVKMLSELETQMQD